MCSATYANVKSWRASATSEDRRRDERRGERGDERVLGGEREPAALAPRGVRAREERVRDEAEGEEERCAPERGHYVVGGGLRRRVVIRALRDQRARGGGEFAVAKRSVDRDVLPRPEQVRHAAAVVDDDAAGLAVADVLHLEAKATVSVLDWVARRPCRRGGRSLWLSGSCSGSAGRRSHRRAPCRRRISRAPLQLTARSRAAQDWLPPRHRSPAGRGGAPVLTFGEGRAATPRAGRARQRGSRARDPGCGTRARGRASPAHPR